MAAEQIDCLAKFGNYQAKLKAGSVHDLAVRKLAIQVLVTYLENVYPERLSLYRCSKVLGTTTLRTIEFVNEAFNNGLVRTEKTTEDKTMVWFLNKDEVNIMTIRWPNIPSRVID